MNSDILIHHHYHEYNIKNILEDDISFSLNDIQITSSGESPGTSHRKWCNLYHTKCIFILLFVDFLWRRYFAFRSRLSYYSLIIQTYVEYVDTVTYCGARCVMTMLSSITLYNNIRVCWSKGWVWSGQIFMSVWPRQLARVCIISFKQCNNPTHIFMPVPWK